MADRPARAATVIALALGFPQESVVALLVTRTVPLNPAASGWSVLVITTSCPDAEPILPEVVSAPVMPRSSKTPAASETTGTVGVLYFVPKVLGLHESESTTTCLPVALDEAAPSDTMV